MIAQRKTQPTKYLAANAPSASKHDENLPGHPDGSVLHYYFSKFRDDFLTTDQRESIGLHLAGCTECATIGKVIQESDEQLDQLISSPPTSEDIQNAMKSIEAFHATLRNGRESAESERILSLTQFNGSQLTADDLLELIQIG